MITRWARACAFVLGNGFILFVFSERMFWSSWRADDDAGTVLGGWLVYSLFAYAMLAILSLFRVSGLWALLAAGAAYGWLLEGIYAMTLFGDPSMPFPFTIAWTALAWHAPLAVVLGWYGLRRALQAPRVWPGLAASSGLGLFWGVWALGWAAETPPVTATLPEFASHAAAAAAGLTASQMALGAGAGWVPSRAGPALAAACLAAFFGAVTVPALPLAPAMLLPLLALAALALWRHRMQAHSPAVLVQMAQPVARRNLLGLAAFPLAATAVYEAGRGLGPLPIHQVLSVVTMAGGTALFIAALVRLLPGGPRAVAARP